MPTANGYKITTTEEAKEYLSCMLGNIQDEAIQMLLRNIIFSGDSKIDWLVVIKQIHHWMPETKD